MCTPPPGSANFAERSVKFFVVFIIIDQTIKSDWNSLSTNKD